MTRRPQSGAAGVLGPVNNSVHLIGQRHHAGQSAERRAVLSAQRGLLPDIVFKQTLGAVTDAVRLARRYGQDPANSHHQTRRGDSAAVIDQLAIREAEDLDP